jgi:hypothetical protein
MEWWNGGMVLTPCRFNNLTFQPFNNIHEISLVTGHAAAAVRR